MRMRLANGVDLTIREDEGHKVLIFSQNVRALDLEPNEATHIGASLYRSKNSVVFPNVVRLLEAGFFDTPKTFKEIGEAIHRESPEVRSNSVVMVLRILCGKGLLSRTGKRCNYVYKKAK